MVEPFFFVFEYVAAVALTAEGEVDVIAISADPVAGAVPGSKVRS